LEPETESDKAFLNKIGQLFNLYMRQRAVPKYKAAAEKTRREVAMRLYARNYNDMIDSPINVNRHVRVGSYRLTAISLNDFDMIRAPFVNHARVKGIKCRDTESLEYKEKNKWTPTDPRNLYRLRLHEDFQ